MLLATIRFKFLGAYAAAAATDLEIYQIYPAASKGFFYLDVEKLLSSMPTRDEEHLFIKDVINSSLSVLREVFPTQELHANETSVVGCRCTREVASTDKAFKLV
jgi:hypothetical protein